MLSFVTGRSLDLLASAASAHQFPAGAKVHARQCAARDAGQNLLVFRGE
jgi:hypothetical protein